MTNDAANIFIVESSCSGNMTPVISERALQFQKEMDCECVASCETESIALKLTFGWPVLVTLEIVCDRGLKVLEFDWLRTSV